MKRWATILVPVTLALVLTGAGVAGQEPPDSLAADTFSPESDVPKHPLRPADTSSPRATLQSFIDNTTRSYRILREARREDRSASVKQLSLVAEELFGRAASCLDLSEIPSALRKEVAIVATLQLKEILDRIELPPFELVPGTIGQGAVDDTSSIAARWRVPNTDIVIARVEDGPREGEYLFTPRTVARVDEFYNEVKNLPYKSDEFTTPGFYEFYISTPGRLVPPRWSRWLPGWSKRLVVSRPLWQWGAVALLLFLWLVVVIVAWRLLVTARAGLAPTTRAWRRALFCLIAAATLLFGYVILREQINLTGTLLIALRLMLHPIWWLFAATMTFFISTAVGESIIASPKIDPAGIQASYFRALFGVLGFVGAAIVFGVGLARINVSLLPLLTGLGIGGLAIALAARPTLEGVISSFTIFADNPYRVGDRITFMGQIGTVEAIGLRSTRVRMINGHLMVIPNEKMAASEVENLGRRPYIRRVFNITITYDTPVEKIGRAVEIVQEILAVPDEPSTPEEGATFDLAHGAHAPSARERTSHPNAAINRPDFLPRVFFNELNSDSLNIYVSYWYHPPEYWDFMEHAHQVNLQIMERFRAEGIDFAFPTQTVHLAGDEKRPLDVGLKQGSAREGN